MDNIPHSETMLVRGCIHFMPWRLERTDLGRGCDKVAFHVMMLAVQLASDERPMKWLNTQMPILIT